MATQSITVNPNFEQDGSIPDLPKAETIASSTFDFVCVILEVIAARIHHEAGGTTASTTTVGLISDVGLLCLTSQNETKFSTTVAEVRAWILELADLDYDAFLTKLDLKYVYDLSEKDITGARSKKDKTSKGTIEAVNFVYYNIYPSFVRLQKIAKDYPKLFQYVSNMISRVKVIRWEHLSSFARQGTGLHGESRFVRYCYIRYVKDAIKSQTDLDQAYDETTFRTPEAHFSQLQPKAVDPEDLELKAARDEYQQAMRIYAESRTKTVEKDRLKEKIGVMKIFVASSQGTCKDCQRLLANLDISHNTHRYSKDTPSPNWIDPFTFQNKDSDMVDESHQAAYQAKLLLEKKRKKLLAAERRAASKRASPIQLKGEPNTKKRDVTDK